METKNLIKKLSLLRLKTLPNFQRIKFTPQAIRTIINLFLHPCCMNTTDLSKFIASKPVALKTISKYILTAFPQTISFYANKHQRFLLGKNDILKCFALEHSEGVAENKIELTHSPAHALAHILTLGQIRDIRHQRETTIADLESTFGPKKIIFKNVFVPRDIPLHKNEKVFQHFGVVIARASGQKLNALYPKIAGQQNKIPYLQNIARGSWGLIDFGKKGLYRFDLLAAITKEAQKPGRGNWLNQKLHLSSNKKIQLSG